MELAFNSHKFITTELNPIFYQLERDLDNRRVPAWLRHENKQLLEDDWKADLLKALDNDFNELTIHFQQTTPRQILEWAEKIVNIIHSYGPIYSSVADKFYFGILTTSLLLNLPEKEVEIIMKEHECNWMNYIKESHKEIQNINKRKETLISEISELEVKLKTKKTEEIELNRILTRSRIARFIDRIVRSFQ